jgi:hypothetical protein
MWPIVKEMDGALSIEVGGHHMKLLVQHRLVIFSVQCDYDVDRMLIG